MSGCCGPCENSRVYSVSIWHLYCNLGVVVCVCASNLFQSHRKVVSISKQNVFRVGSLWKTRQCRRFDQIQQVNTTFSSFICRLRKLDKKWPTPQHSIKQQRRVLIQSFENASMWNRRKNKNWFSTKKQFVHDAKNLPTTRHHYHCLLPTTFRSTH